MDTELGGAAPLFAGGLKERDSDGRTCDSTCMGGRESSEGGALPDLSDGPWAAESGREGDRDGEGKGRRGGVVGSIPSGIAGGAGG